MDTNLVNCPNCSHSVSPSARACAYCGAVISEGEANRQNLGKIPAEPAQFSEPASSLEQEKTPAVMKMPDVSGSAPEAVVEPLEPGFSDLPPAEPAVMEIPESPKVDEPRITEEEVVIEFSKQSAAAENKREVSQENPEIRADVQREPDEAPESMGIPSAVLEPNAELSQADIIPEARQPDLVDHALEEIEKKVESKNISEESPGAPVPDILEIAGNGPVAPDPMGAEILEIVEIGGAQLPPETVPPADQGAARAPTSSVQDRSQVDTQVIKPEPQAVVKSEDSEEEILLTLTDEVNPPSKALADSDDETLPMDTAELLLYTRKKESQSNIAAAEDKADAKAEAIQKPTESQSPPKILKIERAAQDMWDALKKQKAAMAKARTKKKEKLEVARADAAKRKKVALARYQALKKERKSQADIVIPKKEKAAGSISETKDAHPMIVQDLEAKTKMAGLLKKYIGQAIGINYDNTAEIKEAEFIEANDEFFSVFVRDKELHYSYPLKTILTVVEGKDGVGGSDPRQKAKFNAVIKVYPLVL